MDTHTLFSRLINLLDKHHKAFRMLRIDYIIKEKESKFYESPAMFIHRDINKYSLKKINFSMSHQDDCILSVKIKDKEFIDLWEFSECFTFKIIKDKSKLLWGIDISEFNFGFVINIFTKKEWKSKYESGYDIEVGDYEVFISFNDEMLRDKLSNLIKKLGMNKIPTYTNDEKFANPFFKN
jgi:hypothetical protein